MWSSGDVIVRREVWRGRPWTASTLRVVADDGGLLAAYIPEGTPFGFVDDHPLGRHPYSGKSAWHGHGALQLLRPDDAYSVFVFWRGPEREFAGWYVNFQAPYMRTAIGFDTLDHEVDIWIPAGGRWQWKDRERVETGVRDGRFTPEEAEQIGADAARVAAALDAGRTWWSDDWASWQPPAEWLPEPLPAGWETV